LHLAVEGLDTSIRAHRDVAFNVLSAPGLQIGRKSIEKASSEQNSPKSMRPEGHATVPLACTVSGRDFGAAVTTLAQQVAQHASRPFQELLQYFAMERFLHRLHNRHTRTDSS